MLPAEFIMVDKHEKVILPRIAAATLLLAAALTPTPSPAGTFVFEAVNDLNASESVHDDLYTFGVELGYETDSYLLRLTEHAFTDQAANSRFDETALRVARLFRTQSWEVAPEVGILKVGEGFLGQGFQNELPSTDRQRSLRTSST